MRLIIALLLVIAVAALAIVGFAYSGVYDVSATSSDTGIIRWLLSTTSEVSIERRAASVEVPDLSGEQLVLTGASHYDAMCAGCHGAPGRDRSEMGQGLNPEPPDLAHAAEEMSTGELFWTIRNGIKMTGMPAWGVTHDDDKLWAIVAFVRRLPGMTDTSYESLVARADGKGHHESGEHAHDEHEHGAAHTH